LTYVFPPADESGLRFASFRRCGMNHDRFREDRNHPRIASRQLHRNPLPTAPPFFWEKNQKGRAVADTANGISGDRLVRGTGCLRLDTLG